VKEDDFDRFVRICESKPEAETLTKREKAIIDKARAERKRGEYITYDEYKKSRLEKRNE
jgi:hypothetical protein